MPADDVWAVGLDVGGTKIAGGLVRFPAGEVVARRLVPTRAERDAGAVLADAVGMARDLAGAVPPGGRFAGVGLGMPELVDLDGRLASGGTIDWRGVPLADKFAEVGPVWVEADVRAAAVAEARFGAGRVLLDLDVRGIERRRDVQGEMAHHLDVGAPLFAGSGVRAIRLRDGGRRKDREGREQQATNLHLHGNDLLSLFAGLNVRRQIVRARR